MGSLNKLFDYFWKLSPQKLFHNITEPKPKKRVRKELDRIVNIPRYEQNIASIYSYKIIFIDSASFIYQFNEIFSNEIYRFNTTTETPLIYDCGANIGLSVLYFKMLFPNSIIKAFEADPAIARILRENIKNNNLTNVMIDDKAVWDCNCKVSFGTDGADGGSMIRHDNRIEVDAIRLKDKLENESKISLLKLDVEGAEIEILKDCKDSLANVERIFIEYHSFTSVEQKLDVILKILTDLRYKYFMQPISDSRSPFLNSKKNNDMDLQINIYAYKNYK